MCRINHPCTVFMHLLHFYWYKAAVRLCEHPMEAMERVFVKSRAHLACQSESLCSLDLITLLDIYAPGTESRGQV